MSRRASPSGRHARGRAPVCSFPRQPRRPRSTRARRDGVIIAPAAGAAAGDHTLTGDIRRVAGLRSRFLPSTRNVLIYLPPGYRRETSRRFPVLYMQDGQNLFDGATAFVKGREWQLDETAEALIRAGAIEPLIIVAIDNAGLERLNEYGPTVDLRHGMGGGSEAYGRLIVEELKPLIDARFRTRPGWCDTGLGGSSMGGLVTLDAGLRFPEVFGKLAVLSPAVWWDRRVIVDRVRAFTGSRRPRIWLDMGTAEGPYGVRDTRRLRRALLDRGWVLGDTLCYVEASRARHDEEAWGARMSRVLRFLYPPEPRFRGTG